MSKADNRATTVSCSCANSTPMTPWSSHRKTCPVYKVKGVLVDPYDGGTWMAPPDPLSELRASGAFQDFTDREWKLWQELWEPIVVVDGRLDLERVVRELVDFGTLLGNVPKVYGHVTGGAVSHPMTTAQAVCAAHDDHVTQLVEQAASEKKESEDD